MGLQLARHAVYGQYMILGVHKSCTRMLREVSCHSALCTQLQTISAMFLRGVLAIMS